ncbi:uncharacterized protein FFB20_12388 [Fusarium fujikuroi]|nr:uncharacterized protein FFE2_00147 [Fusarium fujikuroi]SCN68830.1 uncharacterized protein FFC1_00144 [Fusarium fujikuroi]SCN71278.1 uncharacterized protein FFM5_00110 [Fusarium fujikuroi]SCO05788.1 uncharacterized protein FFB20_12388 [Fusarium fujikuroi]SCO28123.1 uncharacterized protein FFNC_00145 [Fusarium fujikuroi]
MSDPFQPLKPSRENNGASFQHSMQPHFGLQGHVLIPSTADIPEIAPHYRNQYMPETFSNSNTNDFNEMLTEEIQQQKGMERQDHKVKLGYRRAGVACGLKEEYCVPGYGPEDFTEWTSREASLSPYSQAGQSASSWQLSPYTPTPGENPVILPLEPVLPYVPASMLPTYTSNFEEWDSPCPTSSAPCSEEYYH